jgi:hypothetical protein
MDKKEGGKSQLDVGGKNSHRLSPTYYTSIADIKTFRFRLKRSFPPQRNHQENEISSPRRASAEIHSALVGGADHRSDGLTLPEARRYLSRARGSISTGILPQRPNCRNPNSLGLMLASRLWPLCRNMSRSCISARCFRQITAPVTVRNFFLLPKFHLPGS